MKNSIIIDLFDISDIHFQKKDYFQPPHLIFTSAEGVDCKLYLKYSAFCTVLIWVIINGQYLQLKLLISTCICYQNVSNLQEKFSLSISTPSTRATLIVKRWRRDLTYREEDGCDKGPAGHPEQTRGFANHRLNVT